jgi:hypothetical protein
MVSQPRAIMDDGKGKGITTAIMDDGMDCSTLH